MPESHVMNHSIEEDDRPDPSVFDEASPCCTPPTSPPSEPGHFDDTNPRALPAKRQVLVPDMFSSIMAVKPSVNVNYSTVKSQADSWVARIIQADTTWASRNSKVDLAYLSAVWVPYCDEEALRLMIDWNHWVFLFDDRFDEGSLSNNLLAAQQEIDVAVGIMNETQPRYTSEGNPVELMFQTIWERVKQICSEDMQQHWKHMHRRYFDGVLDQVQAVCDGQTFTRNADEYMRIRRGAIGALPAIAVAEIAQGVHLTTDVLEHPSLQECMCISTDLVILVNDIMSLRKDISLGTEQNLIMLLQHHGLSTQEAVDRLGLMIDDCYERWHVALASMPTWGEEVDGQVRRFVDCCRDVALGNLHWSFKSKRYLGDEGDVVYETRMLDLSTGSGEADDLVSYDMSDRTICS